MSYTNLKYHITFSTDGRRALLGPEVKARLVKYVGGIIRNLKGGLVEADGAEDHLHIVAGVHPSVPISDFVRDVKSNSTKWVRETFPLLRDFGWQDEYAAFTVSHSQLPAVVEYVRNQTSHHAKTTFADELRLLLERHEIPYDERYLVR